MFNKKNMPFWAVIGLLATGLAPQVFAQDYSSRTQADTDVTNTATVTYEVNGDSRTADPATATFKVDLILNMTLDPDGGPVNVIPGEAETTTYTLTNISNGTVDFLLSTGNVDGNDLDGTNTDNQDGTPEILSADVDTTDGVSDYDSSTKIVTLAAGSSATLTVALTANSAALDLEVIGVEVVATAVDGAGNPLDDTAANTEGGVETVFDDGQGPLDGLADGVISVYGVYIVNSATLAVAKSSQVISDPINGIASATNEVYAIPGAVIEYCIDVSNDGSSDAENVVLRDTLPTEVTFIATTSADQVFETGTGECDARTTTHASTQAVFDGTDTVTATFTDPVAASGSVWVSFRVTLN